MPTYGMERGEIHSKTGALPENSQRQPPENPIADPLRFVDLPEAVDGSFVVGLVLGPDLAVGLALALVLHADPGQLGG